MECLTSVVFITRSLTCIGISANKLDYRLNELVCFGLWLDMRNCMLVAIVISPWLGGHRFLWCTIGYWLTQACNEKLSQHGRVLFWQLSSQSWSVAYRWLCCCCWQFVWLWIDCWSIAFSFSAPIGLCRVKHADKPPRKQAMLPI